MKWTESLLKPNCSHILLLKVNTFWSYIASTFILILIYFLFYHRPFLGPRSLPFTERKKREKKAFFDQFWQHILPLPTSISNIYASLPSPNYLVNNFSCTFWLLLHSFYTAGTPVYLFFSFSYFPSSEIFLIGDASFCHLYSR